MLTTFVLEREKKQQLAYKEIRDRILHFYSSCFLSRHEEGGWHLDVLLGTSIIWHHPLASSPKLICGTSLLFVFFLHTMLDGLFRVLPVQIFVCFQPQAKAILDIILVYPHYIFHKLVVLILYGKKWRSSL